MKKILLIVALFVTFVSANVIAAPEESLDQIIAVVNDDVITKSELNKAMNVYKIQLSQQSATIPSESEMKKQVMDQLINKKLQLQVANQANIKVTDEDLDNAIQTVAKQNNMTANSLYERLNEEGMSTEEYRSEIRDQLTLQKLQQQQIVSRVTISPDEIDRFIRNQAMKTQKIKEYLVEDVLIPLSDEPNKDEVAIAKKNAEFVIAKMKQGVQTKTILQTADVKNIEMNELGWGKAHDMPSAFTEAVVSLANKDAVAGPIQTGNGFHVLKLKNLRTIDVAENAPDRKEVEQMLLKRKFSQAIQTWVSKLRGQAFIVANK